MTFLLLYLYLLLACNTSPSQNRNRNRNQDPSLFGNYVFAFFLSCVICILHASRADWHLHLKSTHNTQHTTPTPHPNQSKLNPKSKSQIPNPKQSNKHKFTSFKESKTNAAGYEASLSPGIMMVTSNLRVLHRPRYEPNLK